MNRTDRLMGIVTLLQSRKNCTSAQIAGHFGISERTVYRDLRALDEIGVPITFEKDKGYHLVDGYFLPPVSLSPEEANALALLEPLVIRFADLSILGHYQTAMSKIKMVLTQQQRNLLEQSQSQTAHFIPEQYEHMLPSGTYLSQIQRAISEKTILRITYENTQQQQSFREIEPIGLTFYSLNWHVIAWCHLRKEYRDFRTSRILELKPTIMPFRKKDHLTLSAYLEELEQTVRLSVEHP